MCQDPFDSHWRVLHLEDNENDHLLVAAVLRADGLDCEFARVKSEEEYCQALEEGGYDLIISDFTLPAYDGLSALSLAQKRAPEIPFIFFSGTIGEDLAVASLQRGAMDYVLKQKPGRLTAAVRRSIREAAGRKRLQAAEGALRQSEERLRIVAKATNDVVWEWNMQNDQVWFGENFAAAYGYQVKPTLTSGEWFDYIHAGDKKRVVTSLCSLLAAGGHVWWNEHRLRRGDGSLVQVYDRAAVIYNEAGRPLRLVGIKVDLSERKQAEAKIRAQADQLEKAQRDHRQLEEQFLRAQRLESLGVLVSGIAHDLNNTLAPILIGVEILQTEPLSPEAMGMVHTMGNSARRSAEMVRQMLMFARGGEAVKTHVQPDRLLREMSKVISDTFPKSIRCRVSLGRDLPPLFCVPTQVHQVLMNLCVNARDAMPTRGTITLGAERILLSAEEAAGLTGAKAGKYVCLSVADTGTGIPPELMGKLFQPFFTTKAPGKGTGLGLSTCQGIVNKHDGFMTVRSQPKKGTEFKVYLPAAEAKPVETAAPDLSVPAGKGERVLVVDDEEGFLALTRVALENFGYEVKTAASGLEAMGCLQENPAGIDLVITDHALPLMGGRTIITALRKIRPGIKVILTSGSEKEVEATMRTCQVNSFIAKPFTTEQLLRLAHAVLHG
jgi:PAS domain S-box-containing protein